jgi:ankyrin repeat protein
VAEIEKSLQIIENEKDAESCLTEAYDNAIKRIDEAKSLPLATQLFQWIIYARRPMTMSEIHHALAIKMGDTSFQWKNAVDEATILSKDAGLVREGQDGTLSLNHIKTRRYLENKELIATPIAEADITIACTTYLSFQSFENGPCISRLQVDQRTTSHPFYLYASRYWGSHARTWLQHYGTASDKSSNSEIGKKRGELYSVLKRFLLRTPCVQASIQGYEQSRDIRQGSLNKQKRLIRWEDPSDPPRGERKRQAKGKHKVRTQGETFGFHLAAIYDLRDIVIALVQESGQDISSGDVQGNTPLLHASKAGNSYLVEQLLDHLDEPCMNKQNSRGETPLMVAAMNGHYQVVDTLLRKKGTNVEARDNSGRTALSWASHYGREPVVSQLIDKGQATVTTWASDNLTPLARASAQGHLETVRLLLNTTMTDKTNKQIPKAINGALSKACEKGQIHIVRLFITTAKNQLIKNWCDKMTRCSPLWLATKNKHYEIARLLVKEIEADVRSPDIHGISPMFLAWQSNNLDLLSFFLCNGTQVSQRWPILESIMRRHRNEELAELVFQSNDIEIDLNSEAKGATPLTWAVENDYERLAQILINDSRTDINLKDKELRCPLLVATEKTNERLTMTLIQKEQIEANATNREGSTPLMVALKNSSRTIASILICSGKASLLVQDKEGRTLLHLAAQTDLEDAVKLLLQRESMKLNAQDHDGMTALHIAAKSGFEGIVKLLLPEQDIELAARNQKGLSPLELAIESGHKHITRLLVNSKRLDLTIQDERGRSLLSRAIERGRKDIAGQILEHGYEIVNIKAHDGRNALHVALDKGRKDIVNMLVRDSRASLEKILSSRDAKNRTPLHAAVGSGRKGLVSLITDYCLKTHFRAHDINGNTALHIAVKEGREDLVEVLIRPLEAKVSLTERDNRGLTPLSMAVVQKDIEIIQLILNHVEKNGFSLGANMKDHKGFSPLARAISQNSIDIIKMLSKSTSVNPNWKTKHGYNALSLAVIRKRRLEVKESLVENGAMLNSQDARGRTPLMHAVMKSKKWGKLFPVRDLLKLKDKNGEGIDMNVRDEAGHTALIMAVRLDDVGLVKTLLQHEGLDPNVCCNRRRTALSYACAKGQRLMVELLISHHDEYGSIALEVNLHDTNGFTPFAYAARYRRLRIMKILLDRFDVELDCEDEKGRTPLMYAARQGSIALVQHLLTFSLPQPSSVSSPSSLQSRIDINKQDVKGMTPLMHAVKHGKTKTVGILIDNSADIGIVAKDGKTALALATEKGYRKIAAILRNRTTNFQGRDFERGVSVRQRGRRT